jgi:hypothetical protein
MVSKRAMGSFTTASGLQKIDVETLWNVLKLFEACDLIPNGIKLPKKPIRDSMPYEDLRKFLIQGIFSQDLADVLFHASKLDSLEGWACVQDELADYGKVFDCSAIENDKICYSGCALAAWLRFRQGLPDLLDASVLRLQMSSPYSFVFYPLFDNRKRDEYIEAREKEEISHKKLNTDLLLDKVSTYFKLKAKGDYVRVKHETYEDEDWFIFGYRENVRFWTEIDDEGTEVVKRGRHMGYHVVIYDRKQGMLRMSMKQSRMRKAYREIFGEVLFNNPQAFHHSKNVLTELISLAVLKEDIKEALECAHIVGLDWVKLIKFDYENPQFPLLKHTVDWNPKLSLAEIQLRNLLKTVQSVSAAHFRYALTPNTPTGKEKSHRLTVKNGNELGFEQDAGTRIILDWLFDRRFFKEGESSCHK